jgi:electron transfer flavoprotein beta subunit
LIEAGGIISWSLPSGRSTLDERSSMLKIIVCVKVVVDPEAPASTFKLDPEGQRALPAAGVPPVLNPYDENALEAALKIKDARDCRIAIVSAGKTVPKAVVRKCLAVGADDLFVIEDEIFDSADSHTTALVLAAAVRKLGEFDIVLAGRMAADTNAGQVGPGLAELLGVPGVTVARKIEVDGECVRIERALAEGHELVETGLPCLVTVSHELGELRAAGVKGMMAAQKQPFTTWKLGDLGVEAPAASRSRTLRLFIPVREVNCEMVTAETPEAAGAALAIKMRDSDCL